MVKITLTVCDECGTCIGVCPADALVFNTDLRVDGARCTRCGRCVKVCPFGALSLTEKEEG
jgi:ferredoxin